ncbi:MAG: ABC transporter substrate-binding protein [Chloroflexi bacterium]|nr:ABC transporter substrate-binding protein [Chloroflexota bacterium]
MLRKTLWFVTLLLMLVSGACSPATTVLTKSPNVTAPATEVPTKAPVATATAASDAIILTDGLGREIFLKTPAQRVVSLAPSLTEILFAIGAGSQVVGRDENSDYPEETLKVESVGSTYQTLNTESILALDPDLVVAAGINSPEQIKALEDLGVTVYFFENPTDFAGMYEHLHIMGKLTGHEGEATDMVESLQKRVEAVQQKVAALTERPTVFYEIDGSDPSKPWTSGPGTFMDAMITQAGGINIGGVLSDPFAQISLEEIVKQNPNFIILGDTKWGVTIESIGEREGWGELTAVKESKIFSFDDNLSSRPGPRLVDGLEALLVILHPELAPVP